MRGVVVFSILTLARVSQGAFYLSTEESNWFNVSSLCKLATPNIVRGFGGHYADVYGIDLQNNEKIWTGFYRTMKILEYIDCVHLDDILKMNARLLAVGNEGSLAKCISECGRSHLVGVTKSKCFCIDEKSFNRTTTSKETDCTNQCRYPQGVACGFESVNDTYLSVYKHNDNVSGSSFVEKGLQEEEKHCLALNVQTKKFYWEDCIKKYDMTCFSGHGTIRIDGRSSWMEAANRCFLNKLVPLSSSNSKTVINNKGGYVWTGTIRMNIIYKVDNYYSEEENEERTFGILTKMPSNDKYLLTFENGLERRRSLCQGRSFGSTNFSTLPTTLIVVCVIFSAVVVSFVVIYKIRKAKKQVMKKIATNNQQEEGELSAEANNQQERGIYFILEPNETQQKYKEPMSPCSVLDGANMSNVSQINGTGEDEIIIDHASGESWHNEDNEPVVNKEEHVKVTFNSSNFGAESNGKTELSDVEYNRLDFRNENRGKHSNNFYERTGVHHSSQDRGKQSDVVYNRLGARKNKGKQHTDNTYDSFGAHLKWKSKLTDGEYNRIDDKKTMWRQHNSCKWH